MTVSKPELKHEVTITSNHSVSNQLLQRCKCYTGWKVKESCSMVKCLSLVIYYKATVHLILSTVKTTSHTL